MTDTAADTLTVLRRKAGAGRAPPEIGAMTPEKAMRLAFGRAGRDIAALQPRLTGFSMDRVSLAALAGAVPPQALIALLDGPETAVGAVMIDAQSRAAVIEALTMGRVDSTDIAEREATRVDAVILSGFLDKSLELFDELAADLPMADAVSGFRMAQSLTGAAALALALEDVAYRLFRLNFEFADKARSGEILIALPFDPPVTGDQPDASASFVQALQARVMEAEARVDAVLCRITLPLSQLSGWSEGLLLPIGRETLTKILLEDIDGEPVGKARLGQVNGFRAVRLLADDGGAEARALGAGFSGGAAGPAAVDLPGQG